MQAGHETSIMRENLHNRGRIALLAGLGLATCALPSAAAPAAPTAEQMQAALAAAARSHTKPVSTIANVGGCYPANAAYPRTMLCMLRFSGRDADEQIAFRSSAAGWEMLDD